MWGIKRKERIKFIKQLSITRHPASTLFRKKTFFWRLPTPDQQQCCCININSVWNMVEIRSQARVDPSQYLNSCLPSICVVVVVNQLKVIRREEDQRHGTPGSCVQSNQLAASVLQTSDCWQHNGHWPTPCSSQWSLPSPSIIDPSTYVRHQSANNSSHHLINNIQYSLKPVDRFKLKLS